MDNHFDRFHAEADHTKHMLREWIKPFLIQPDTDKLQEKLSRFWYVLSAGFGGMSSFESERCLGIYAFLLELELEETLVLRWRHSLSLELAAKRIDLRYLLQALNDCEALVANDKEGVGTRGEIKLLLGQLRGATHDLFDADSGRKSALYWLPLAQAYLAMGHMDQAIELLNRKIQSEDYQLHSAMALRSRAFDLIGDTHQRDVDRNAIWDAAKKEKPDRPLEYVIELDMRAGNYRRILDEIPSSARSRDGMQTGEVLALRAKALRSLAEQNCDENLINAAIECWREILTLDPDYTEAWFRLIQELESLWRYDDLIEMSETRPAEDIKCVSFMGCCSIEHSLHHQYETREPYWRGRMTLLDQDYEDALVWFGQAECDRETRWMETAMCCFKTEDHDRLQASFDQLCP